MGKKLKWLDILKEREQMINNVLPEMRAKYKSVEKTEEARFFKGVEGFKLYLQTILDFSYYLKSQNYI